MHFNWKKIKQSVLSYLPKLNPINYSLIVLSIIYFINASYSFTGVNSQVSDRISPNEASSIINAQNKAIIIVNGQPTENYLIRSLKKQGFFLINLVTATSKIGPDEISKAEAC
ncbi:MAG: hypothetical protein K2Y08_07185 [Alphaproteobacteria bacterium]|jgi:hypothetical protein|nr:hypothetical protein [Alphaproteobacteria bacterium]